MTGRLSRYLSKQITNGEHLPIGWSILFILISISIFYICNINFTFDSNWKIPARYESKFINGVMVPNGVVKKGRPIKVKSGGKVYNFTCIPNSADIGCYDVDKNKISGKNIQIEYFYEYNHKSPGKSNIILEITSNGYVIKSYASRLLELKKSRDTDKLFDRYSYLGKIIGALIALYLSWSIIAGKSRMIYKRMVGRK